MNTRTVLAVLVAVGLGFSIAQLGPQAQGRLSAQAAERSQVPVDDTKAVAVYANFCRVTGTPEEVILDCGLNTQPVGIPKQPISVSQRIVMSFYTAKRLHHALGLTIQRHEATFGTLELDLQKRVKPGADTPNSAPAKLDE